MKSANKTIAAIILISLCTTISCMKNKDSLPILNTTDISEVTHSTAISGGDITNDGGAPIISRGVCWGTAIEPTILDSKSNDSVGLGRYSSKLIGLKPKTTYFVRAYGTTSLGTGYGVAKSFTTNQPIMPVVSTSPISSISLSKLIIGGLINDDGGTPVTARGVCWSINQNPLVTGSKTIDGSGIGSFTSTITGFNVKTDYYIKAYATNSIGTAYGNVVAFSTHMMPGSFNSNLIYGSLSDYEGNIYKTIAIGTQIWMAENLKSIKLNDGTSIQLVTENASWENATSAGYSIYNNEIGFKDTHGVLYNWHTVSTGKLCPAGWHVPTHDEWKTLTNYLGDYYSTGRKIREIGTIHWYEPNTNSTNESGFTALPSGERYNNGEFNQIGVETCWWTSTMDQQYVYNWVLGHNQNQIGYQSGLKTFGAYVRCIKD